ncbi:MAG: hypothetical protein Q8K70_12060 [Bacteroidota bacterium]|nr:hypothetical protein [Bacteroidota bacterium]
MGNQEIIEVLYLGKPINDEPNVYKRKALIELKQIYEFLLHPFMDEIKACRGYIIIHLYDDFKKEKIDCNVPCLILRKKIKITLSKYFNRY